MARSISSQLVANDILGSADLVLVMILDCEEDLVGMRELISIDKSRFNSVWI